MRYQLFGGLRVADDARRPVDVGGPKQRSVLAALLLEPGRSVSADRLIDQVWGDDPPNRAEVSLQAYVSNLRRAVEPGRKPREAPRVLLTNPAGYALCVERDQVDIARFEDLAALGHEALRSGDAAGAATTLDQALAERVGPLLPELGGEGWVDEAAVRLNQVRALALEDRFEAGLALGEHLRLIPQVEAAVVEEPYRERLRHQHALALYRSGRQRDALSALQAARRTLVDEVGIEPGAELRQLEADILAQAPSLDLAPAAAGDRRRADDPRWQRPGRDRRRATGPVTDGAANADGAGAVRSFIGRRRELDALLDAAASLGAGSGRPVVVSGEPGIGKTRLVEELVARIPDAAVAWGRCPEHATNAAFWPCIQIGRQLEGAGALAAELVSDLLPDDDAPISDEPGADRLGLHLAITRTLGSASRPVVLVVDDLQWADPGSLRVLEFIAGDLHRVPVLLVVTCRPVTADAPPALVDCLGELARQPDALRLDLTGLEEADVARWVDQRSGGRADRSVAASVHGRTAGNPFFVGEVIELLASEDRLDDLDAGRGAPVPMAVQDVVRRRVSRLPAESQQLLAAASVIGRTFDLDVVATVTGSAPDEVLDRLDPSVEAGLVEEGDAPGRFQFAHALVADSLAAESSAIRRARLHAAAARALARPRAADAERQLAEVAHHAFAGMAAGTADLAHEWSVRAARSAAARLAHEDAAEHWGRAVQALEVADPTDRVGRFDALLAQGRALLRADVVGPAYVVLAAAIELAIALEDPDRVGQAAAAMHVDGVWFVGEMGLEEMDPVACLERALAAMGTEPSADLALALSALSENAYWTWPAARLEATSAEAVRVARAVGDDAVLGRALHKRNQALWRAATLDERRVGSDELLALIDAGRTPPALTATGLFGAAGVAWESADVVGAAALLARARELADSLGSPVLFTQLDFFQATLEVWHGQLEEALRSIDRAYQLYRRTRRWSADAFRAGFEMAVWVEQDRVDQVVELGPAMLDTPYRPWFQEGYAWALCEVGLVDEARQVIGGDLPPDLDCWLYLGVLGAAAHTRCALGDHQAAAVLRERMVPYAGLLATTGTGVAFGPIAAALARVDLLLGDRSAAAGHADRAVALAEAQGAGPWLARSLLLRAEITGDVADHDRAGELIDAADLALLRRRL